MVARREFKCFVVEKVHAEACPDDLRLPQVTIQSVATSPFWPRAAPRLRLLAPYAMAHHHVAAKHAGAVPVRLTFRRFVTGAFGASKHRF